MGLQVFLWLPPITLILLEASFAPASYGLSTPPPDRTDIIPTFILVAGLAVWELWQDSSARLRRQSREAVLAIPCEGLFLAFAYYLPSVQFRMTYVE